MLFQSTAFCGGLLWTNNQNSFRLDWSNCLLSNWESILGGYIKISHIPRVVAKQILLVRVIPFKNWGMVKMNLYKHSYILGYFSLNRLYRHVLFQSWCFHFHPETRGGFLAKWLDIFAISFPGCQIILFKAITKHDLLSEWLKNFNNLIYVCITCHIPPELMGDNSALMIPR